MIPTPTKTKSGAWRIQLCINGNRISKTFDSKKDAIMYATLMKVDDDEFVPKKITVTEAVERHITLKEVVLSQTTIDSYRKIMRNQMSSIAEMRVDKLTNNIIQLWINEMVEHGWSLKTIKNAHGLLMAVVKENRPRFISNSVFPKEKKTEQVIPSEEEISIILSASAGTQYELPIVLALFCGLRASEIRGLKWSDYDGIHLSIERAIVYSNGKSIEKLPKSNAGQRTMLIHPFVSNLLDQTPHRGEYIVDMTGQAMYKGFTRICASAGIPHFRFHALRHFQASAMIVSGMPDKYAIGRMGHSTTSILQNVYQHELKTEKERYEEGLNRYLDRLIKHG